MIRSRDVFSPTKEEQEPSPKEYIPVKEKAKIIELQQEELERREEAGQENIKGGVRILPPSPTTVRKEIHQSTATSSDGTIYKKTVETTTKSEASSDRVRKTRNVNALYFSSDF